MDLIALTRVKLVGLKAATAVFLSLAEWPYGGAVPCLGHPARAALVVATAAAPVVASFSGTSVLCGGVREDRRN